MTDYPITCNANLTAAVTVDRGIAYDRHIPHAELFESYTTNDDTYIDIPSGTQWFTETFTPSTSHPICAVKLLIYRSGSPGTITVSIQGVDGEGKPDGGDLCSGTTDGDTLTEAATGEWRWVLFSSTSYLVASTQYAIVGRALSADASNRLRVRIDNSSPTYTGGVAGDSADSGSSWTLVSTRDILFEEWGYGLGLALNASNTISKAVTFGRTTTASITASATIVRNLTWSIATSANVTVSTTISKVIAFVRTIQSGITAATTLDRGVTFSRTITANLTAAITVVRTVAWGIATSVDLAVSTTISRLVAFDRTITANLTAATSIRKAGERLMIRLVSTQYRKIRSVKSQYRKIRSITSGG